jgi:hypothetical protein
MSPFEVTGWITAACLIPVVLAIGSYRLRKRNAPRDIYRDVASRVYTDVSEVAASKHGLNPAHVVGRRRHLARHNRTHSRTLAAIATSRSILLTPRMLERVNLQRKMRNRQPLTREGFQNAIAHAWDRPAKQPDTLSTWLSYLIVYEVLYSDIGHSSNRIDAHGNQGIAIDATQPYNGQGGEFGGAGASGTWEPGVAQAGAAIAGGSNEGYAMGGDTPKDGFAYSNTANSDGTKADTGAGNDAAPSYSGSDTSTSSTFDASPAPSIDTSTPSTGD